jgi:hypothetical protein
MAKKLVAAGRVAKPTEPKQEPDFLEVGDEVRGFDKETLEKLKANGTVVEVDTEDDEYNEEGDPKGNAPAGSNATPPPSQSASKK